MIELDIVEKADLVAKGKASEGSKTRGSLMATLATTAGSALIPRLANSLQSRLSRHEKMKIMLELGGNKLEVTGNRLCSGLTAITNGKK